MLTTEIYMLLDCYRGKLFFAEDKRFRVTVSYNDGAIPMFSKLELLIINKSGLNFREENGKVIVNSIRDFEEAIKLHLFRFYTPILELVLAGEKTVEDELFNLMVENVKEDIKNGLYSFGRFRENRLEVLVVAVGENLSRKGLFYYPEYDGRSELGSPVELIKLNDSQIEIFWDNIKKVAEV